MKYIILSLLFVSLGLHAQWPVYDIGTTLEIGGVHVKENGTVLISGGSGLLKQSSDCGNTWNDIAIPYFDDLGKMQFIDASHAYMIGDDGNYAQSSDGGSSWTIHGTPAPDNLESLYFLNTSIGFMVGKEGAIVHTSNGGGTWTLQASNTVERLEGVFFTDALHGIVSGRNETLLKTDNGGSTWTAVNTGINGDLRSIYFNAADNGFICAEGGLYHINADLSSIEFMSLDPNADFQDIFFMNANVGWTCSDIGTVFVTNNGGLDWLQITLDGLPFQLNAIHGRSLNSAFTVGDIGKVNGLCTITSSHDIDSFQDLLHVSLTADHILIEVMDGAINTRYEMVLYDLKGSAVSSQSSSTDENGKLKLERPRSPGLYLLEVVGNSTHFTTKLSLN